MAKGHWGKPGYKGSIDPISSANYLMFILLIIVGLGFIQAAIKNKWFDTLLQSIS